MRATSDSTDEGSWPLAMEYYGRGDPAFVAEIRRISDADLLGEFVATWYSDPRPAARQMMRAYLQHPLNAFRHEALVKRLFKTAEKAGDHETMAWFLVAFDRGFAQATIWRPQGKELHGSHPLQAEERKRIEQRRLFSVGTRIYLRRRAWRYFRKLGKLDPERYVPGVAIALEAYEDADLASAAALLDNWGLLHVLFHNCPAIEPRAGYWRANSRGGNTALAPAPIFEALWRKSPQTLLDLLLKAHSRTVRQWALFLIRRDHAGLLATLSVEQWLGLLASNDPQLIALAAEALARIDLTEKDLERCLGLLTKASPESLDFLCDLLTKKLIPGMLPLSRTIDLAAARPFPIARLGFAWLKSKSPSSAEDCGACLRLLDAESAALRPEMMRWLRGVLLRSPQFRAEWVLEFLDARHDDVRAEGWSWFLEDARASDNHELWHKLLESPYDDIKLKMITKLEAYVQAGKAATPDQEKLDGGSLRFLWASVLCNIHRGGRAKPLVVGRLVKRLLHSPEEADVLFPLLSVALRSLRGPEWRAGLVGVVQAVDRNPELAPLVKKMFPELQIA